MKSFSRFLTEEKTKTILHKLGWQDADEWTGDRMSFQKKISIANEKAKKIGNGSGRTAFEIDEARYVSVMKIAKNVKGFRQNLAEVNLYKKYDLNPPYMVPMIEYDDNENADTSWILLHKATKFDENIFYREFGVSFAEWRKVLSAIINKDEHEEKKNKKIKEFVKFCKSNRLQLGEYRQKSNWGIYKSKPVILDAGLTKDNMSIAL